MVITMRWSIRSLRRPDIRQSCGILGPRDWHWLFRSGLWVTLGTLLIRVIATSTVLMHADLAGTANHLDDFLTRIKRLDASFMPPETLLTSWRQGTFL